MDVDCGVSRVRPWRRSDRADLLAIADDRAVWRNLSHRFPHPYTEAEANDWLAFNESAADDTRWAIEVDGRVAGGIGIEPGEGVFAKKANFGYWLGRPYWGRGLMTATVRATVDAIFHTFDLSRLEAAVYAWNPASMRVLEKSGFVREGVLARSIFKDGEIVDSVLYARLR